MLFTKPMADPKPLSRIVFIADCSDHGLQALKKTLPLAAAESCERLYVIRIITTFDEARAAIGSSGSKGKDSSAHDEEEEALEQFVLSAGATEVPIEVRCVRGNTGLVASDFVQSVKRGFAGGAAAEERRSQSAASQQHRLDYRCYSVQSLGDPLREAPSSNTQVPEKFQSPSSRLGQLVDRLELWISLDVGAWILEFVFLA